MLFPSVERPHECTMPLARFASLTWSPNGRTVGKPALPHTPQQATDASDSRPQTSGPTTHAAVTRAGVTKRGASNKLPQHTSALPSVTPHQPDLLTASETIDDTWRRTGAALHGMGVVPS